MNQKFIIKISVLLCLLYISCKDGGVKDINLHKEANFKGCLENVPIDRLSPPSPIKDFLKEELLYSNTATTEASQAKSFPAEAEAITAVYKILNIPKHENMRRSFSFKLKDSIVFLKKPEIIEIKDGFVKERNPYSFISYMKPQGLKHNQIYGLVEDKIGNIWFGTRGNGITKFNGKSFVHYNEKSGLNIGSIWDLFIDSKDNLWICGAGGIVKFDGQRFFYFVFPEHLNIKDILSCTESPEGDIWMATNNGAILYNGDSFLYYSDKNGFECKNVWNIKCDKNGNTWFATDNGLYKLYHDKLYSFKEDVFLGKEVKSLFCDSDGNVFAGNYFGLFVSKDGKWLRYNQLKDYTINSIIKSKDNIVWLGTDVGLVKFDLSLFTIYSDNDGLISNNVSSVLIDKRNNIWVGQFMAGGLSRFEGEVIRHITEFEGIKNSKAWSIMCDNSGKLWFGALNGGLTKYDGKTYEYINSSSGFVDDIVVSQCQDTDDIFWFGTNRSGFIRFDGKTFTKTKFKNPNYNYIWKIFHDKKGRVWMATALGGVVVIYKNNFYNISTQQGLLSETAWDIIEDKMGDILVAGTRGITKIRLDENTLTIKRLWQYKIPSGVWGIKEDAKKTIWIASSGNGLFKLNDTIVKNYTEKDGLTSNYIGGLLFDKKGNLFIGTKVGISMLDMKEYSDNIKLNLKSIAYNNGYFGYGINNSATNMCFDSNNNLWVTANDRITIINTLKINKDTLAPVTQINKIEIFDENLFWPDLENKKDTSIKLSNGIIFKDFNFTKIEYPNFLPVNLSLSYTNNYITFYFNGVTLRDPGEVKFQYKLSGLNDNWSQITKNNFASFGNLEPGEYVFMVKSVNVDGYWSDSIEYKFCILPPWWKTWWFRLIFSILLVSVIILYIKIREQNFIKRQKVLEKKIIEATTLVRTQKDNVEKQKETLEIQKKLIEVKQKEILDSINYAKRIQYTLLAHDEFLKENLKDYFTYFNPKDVVSGDFYWATKHNNKFYLAVCDSTGHGVPGAFMSLLNIGFLNEAINEKGIDKPNEVFDYVRMKLTNSISKAGQRDGFDGVLVCFDMATSTITYAAANNTPILIQNNQLVELQSDRMPVGVGEIKENFSLHKIDAKSGDMLYLYSDGYADQFGGPKGKKFKYKQLNELLFSIYQKPLIKQKQQLESNFNSWKGELEQIDDVCVIGVSF